LWRLLNFKMKKIIPTIIILATLILSINYIFFPAYLSVKSACDPIGFQETYGEKYQVAGSVTIIPTEEGMCEVEFFVADIEDLPTIKHESCHVNQYNQGRFYSCDNLFGKYRNELECYSVQRFWEIKELF